MFKQVTFKMHLPIHDHTSIMDYPIKQNNFSIVDNESQGVTRTLKEAMFIRDNNPSLNRNLGKYQLPNIWYEVLQDTLSLSTVMAPLPLVPHVALPHNIWGHVYILLVSMVLLGVPSSPHFLIVPFFPTIFWHQNVGIGKYNIFPQTWRSVVGDEIAKACLTKILHSVFFSLI